MARYSLFVLKVPLNHKQTNKQTSNRLLPDGAADSTRCIHCVVLLNNACTRSCEQSANVWERTM